MQKRKAAKMVLTKEYIFYPIYSQMGTQGVGGGHKNGFSRHVILQYKVISAVLWLRWLLTGLTVHVHIDI